MKTNLWSNIFITIFVISLLIVTNTPLKAKDKDINNPFNDYRVESKQSIENDKDKPKNIDDDNKEKAIYLPFEWKGLICSSNKYIVLIRQNNLSHFIEQGETISGFTLIDITLEKLIFEKNGQKAVLTMRSDLNE